VIFLELTKGIIPTHFLTHQILQISEIWASLPFTISLIQKPLLISSQVPRTVLCPQASREWKWCNWCGEKAILKVCLSQIELLFSLLGEW
jgi:hypothetical protein